jgi:glycosidase
MALALLPLPQRDGGYDVADYCDVDPLFGTLDDFDALLTRAHEHGLKVIVDIVPNHSSTEHRWLQEALAAGPGSPERARYFFRDGRGEGGTVPPNNWESVFGGPAWTRVIDADGTPGQWYLHLFKSSQPDFDWSNPWVADRFDEVLRFWLDTQVWTASRTASSPPRPWTRTSTSFPRRSTQQSPRCQARSQRCSPTLKRTTRSCSRVECLRLT